MDCVTFFEELKREFLSRGMDFRYLPDKFSYGDIFKAKPPAVANKNDIVLADARKNNKNLIPVSTCKGGDRFPHNKNCLSRHYSYVIVRDDQDFEMFSGLSDMVYRLALKLAKSIGRLPGHLHARMVLSTDEHPAVKKYISRYGA